MSSVQNIETQIDRALELWLREHLNAVCPASYLGVICAGLGVVLSDIAPAHLAAEERGLRLIEYLSHTGAIRALSQALLTDETTAPKAEEHGLRLLLGEGGSGSPRRLPRQCHPVAMPAVWVGRRPEMAAIDGFLQAGARVISLVGPPGVGKSALLLRFLRERGMLPVDGDRTPPTPVGRHPGLGSLSAAGGIQGLLYFSLTSDPDVVAFLRAAAEYAEGRDLNSPPDPLLDRPSSDDDIGRRQLNRLLRALGRRSGVLVLALDGLERFQVRKPPLPESGKGPEPTTGAATPSPLEVPPLPISSATQPGSITDALLTEVLGQITYGSYPVVLLTTLEQPLPLLSPWRGKRYQELVVPPLIPAEGGVLLRQLGVSRGSDRDAEQRSTAQGGHPLSLVLTARYLACYYQGDARAALRSEASSPDSHPGLRRGLAATGLFRVLAAQLQALAEEPRRLLSLFALIPGPVRTSALRDLCAPLPPEREISRPDREISRPDLPLEPLLPSPYSVAELLLPVRSTPAGKAALREAIAGLESCGLLVLTTLPDGSEIADLHPILRATIYRAWLLQNGGTAPQTESDPEGGLVTDPVSAEAVLPRTDPALSLLEQLVSLLIDAGHPEVAFSVLCVRLGGYLHLVHHLGRPRQFLGLVRRLYPSLASLAVRDARWQRRYSQLLSWEAETLRVLGQLDAALITAQRQWPLGAGPVPASLCRQARILRHMGRLEQAEALAKAARDSSSAPADSVVAAIEQATVALLRGDPALCQIHLLDAELLLREEPPLGALRRSGLTLSIGLAKAHALRALRLGLYAQAKGLVSRCLADARERRSDLDVHRAEVLLADILRHERCFADALPLLRHTLAQAERIGDRELMVHGGLVESRLLLDWGRADEAATAVDKALERAIESGFVLDRIDLTIARGFILVRRGEIAQAESAARDALSFASAPGCGYTWGEADALHLLSTILLTRRPPEKTPQHEEAVAHLSDELDLREHMGAPGAIEVRCMLRRIRA